MNRPPPHDLALERAVLGELLADPTGPLPVLDPEHYYRTAHREIYGAIQAIRAKGDTADLVTVTAHFQRLGTLGNVGGAAYLSDLGASFVPGAAKRYADKLVDLWRLRQAIVRAREIELAAYEAQSSEDLRGIFSKASAELTPKSGRLVGAKEGLRATFESIEEAWNGKGVSGFPLGYSDLDLHVQVTAGDLVVVAGRPGMGKSAFGIGSAARMARNGLKVSYFSLEMSRDALWKRAISDSSGVALERVRTGTIRDEDWSRLTRAAGQLAECSLWIDDSPAAGVSYVEGQAQRIRDEHGLDVVIVDHLHRMREKGKWSSQREMYDEILVRSKNMAKSISCAVVLLAQLNRGVEDRNPPRPFLSDLRETGRIEEEADTVLMLYRPEYYLREKCEAKERGLGYVQVEKQREGKSGFDVRLAWSEQHAAYRDLAR